MTDIARHRTTNFRGSIRMPVCLASLLALLVLPVATLGQGHAGHQPQSGFNSVAVGIIAESVPANDAVLAVSPDILSLSFDRQVRLVKLVLHNEQHDWIDIGFRYRPRHDDRFDLSIPLLQETDYYTADWAILDEQDRLVRGSFSFTFGSGREAPSSIMQRAMQMQNDSRDRMRTLMELDYEPAEIIINGREVPPFEEPFAPVLQSPQRQPR